MRAEERGAVLETRLLETEAQARQATGAIADTEVRLRESQERFREGLERLLQEEGSTQRDAGAARGDDLIKLHDADGDPPIPSTR